MGNPLESWCDGGRVVLSDDSIVAPADAGDNRVHPKIARGAAGVFATGVAALALIGGAWLAYRVLFDIPWPAVVALGLALVGLITGSLIRFNVVKLDGREHESADRGYVQLFGTDLEYVVTDRWELGPTAIRLWTTGHILTVPVMLVVIWVGLGRSADAES